MSYLIYLMVYVIKLLSAKTWICLYNLIQACQMKNCKKINTLYWPLLKELTCIYVSKAAKSATP